MRPDRHRPPTDVVRGPVLRLGDRVRLVSPASTPDAALVTAATATLRSWGLVPELGAHALDRWGFCAGRDDDRLADLDDAFRDPGVRAVVTTRGGAGAYRIADRLDTAAVDADPKPVVGFSDVTHLHAALWSRHRLATVHGWLVGERACAGVRDLLMTTAPVVVRPEPGELTAQVGVSGRAEGTLLGGNLSALAHEVGTGMLDLDGAILLLEDSRTIGLGRVDRQLTQLRRSGALRGVRGVALGRFAGFEDYTDRGWTLLDVLQQHLDGLGVPARGGFAIGHTLGGTGGFDQSVVPLGTGAVLDTTAGTLTVDACVR